MSGWYETGYKISFWIIFIICWIYCIATYGFLLGVGLGWLASGIAAGVLSFFWPVLLFLLVLLIVFIVTHIRG